MALTTAIRVRQRWGVPEWEADDTAIAQFIADAEAVIYSATGHSYSPGDEDYELVCSLCTSLAAESLLLALVNPPDSKPDPEKTMRYLKSLPELRAIINRDFSLLPKRERLPRSKEIPLPRNTIR